jgi:2-keto-4-pentenoate hydratase/2-oxohepta-3-ene-1,7-dioic acid hydratase in catechol pathway
MRLTTVRSGDGGTRLFAGADGGWFDVREAAGLDAASLANVTDVGSLYRAGPDAVEGVRRIATAPPAGAALRPLDELALAPIVTSPATIMCIGHNYMRHIREHNAKVPSYPVLFAKFPNVLVGHGDPVIAHQIATQMDYEGELAVVIGQRASRVPAGDWEAVVAGYTIMDDVSDRVLQRGDVQWIRGKSLDTWAPLGSVFVSRDEVPDPHALRLRTWVNGELRQDETTGDMLFRIPQLIEFITQGITLQPGDVIATGTPSGVGMGFDPPRWLNPGDVVEIEVEGVGRLRNRIVAPA